jgi:hypothetical protein
MEILNLLFYPMVLQQSGRWSDVKPIMEHSDFPEMEHNQQTIDAKTPSFPWTKVGLACLICSAVEIFGIYKYFMHKASMRAYVSPCIFASLLVLISLLLLVFAFMLRDKHSVKIAVSLLCVGLSPIITAIVASWIFNLLSVLHILHWP